MTPQERPVPLPGPGHEHSGAIDAVMAGLVELDALPVDEHVARFDAVHSALSDALSSIDKV
jgi:hypothetical protein